MLTHAEVLELISYDPVSGLFTVRQATCCRPVGQIMNCNQRHAQRSGRKVRRSFVSLRGLGSVPAGRLAWFYMTGEWPKGEIDHRDNDGWNQAWMNLRESSRSQNQANTRRYKSNSSGKKCVFPSGRKAKPWRAQIQKDKRRLSLGYFETRDAAHAAYVQAAVTLFGDYARVA
jgi:hypothetical protein